MEISSSEEGLGCQSIYRALGVLDGDINFYTSSEKFGYEEFEFESVLIGSAALAVHADRKGLDYKTDTKDVDLYTNADFTGLEEFEKLPQASMTNENGSQYNYNVAASATDVDAPDTFVDVITDFEQAFGWSSEDADEVERMLSGEIGASDPLMDNSITVYLPGLETLEETFERSERDYSERLDMIDEMHAL